MRLRQSNFRLLIETNSLHSTKEIDKIGHFFYFLLAISEALTQSITEIGALKWAYQYADRNSCGRDPPSNLIFESSPQCPFFIISGRNLRQSVWWPKIESSFWIKKLNSTTCILMKSGLAWEEHEYSEKINDILIFRASQWSAPKNITRKYSYRA